MAAPGVMRRVKSRLRPRIATSVFPDRWDAADGSVRMDGPDERSLRSRAESNAALMRTCSRFPSVVTSQDDEVNSGVCWKKRAIIARMPASPPCRRAAAAGSEQVISERPLPSASSQSSSRLSMHDARSSVIPNRKQRAMFMAARPWPAGMMGSIGKGFEGPAVRMRISPAERR